MNFCNFCGGSLTLRIPEGDNRDRHICVQCEIIHYQNPKIVTGCLPIYKDKVLMCRRAIDPQKGLWTLPAGFMENGETIADGAARETWEEARAKVEIQQLYCVINLPYIHQIYMMYLARLPEPVFAAGEESLEVTLMTEDEIPWKELAFRTISTSLKHYFAERKTGEFTLHEETLAPPKSFTAL